MTKHQLMTAKQSAREIKSICERVLAIQAELAGPMTAIQELLKTAEPNTKFEAELGEVLRTTHPSILALNAEVLEDYCTREIRAAQSQTRVKSIANRMFVCNDGAIQEVAI